MYLDDLDPILTTVGAGTLGRHGALGQHGKPVCVLGRFFEHAIAAHAPAVVQFDLGKAYSYFRCKVALNDDAIWDAPVAEFKVILDRKEAAHVSCVRPGRLPEEIIVDVRGVSALELRTTATGNRFLHTVWLDPELIGLDGATLPAVITGITIVRPATPVRSRRCVATVVSAGFAPFLDTMLSTLYANGCVPDAQIAVFAAKPDAACRKVIRKYEANLIECTTASHPSMRLKSVLYSVAHAVDADEILCLDADTLVLGDLRPIFFAIRACPRDRIFVCAEMNAHVRTLGEALTSMYGGSPKDAASIGVSQNDVRFSLVVNAGVFAGGRVALLQLDRAIRGFPDTARDWERAVTGIPWREQFLFNLALARLNCAVQLDDTYNVQMLSQDVEIESVNGVRNALYKGQPARILHFNGERGRTKYAEFASVFRYRDDAP